VSDPDCVFCGIVEGRIPSKKVREDELTIAFHDITPHAPVHILVIPREHFADLTVGIPEHADLVAAVLRAAHEVALSEGVADGWRLVFNNGARSGQSVFHCHAHVMGYPAGNQAQTELSAH
jgi:histidine triad (HIT) family protein